MSIAAAGPILVFEPILVGDRIHDEIGLLCRAPGHCDLDGNLDEAGGCADCAPSGLCELHAETCWDIGCDQCAAHHPDCLCPACCAFDEDMAREAAEDIEALQQWQALHDHKADGEAYTKQLLEGGVLVVDSKGEGQVPSVRIDIGRALKPGVAEATVSNGHVSALKSWLWHWQKQPDGLIR